MIHVPDPDYLDQMPAPAVEVREHIWRASSDKCARCWCQPFPYPGCGVIEEDANGKPVVKPMWLHRPHGCVFWEHGEQGPNLYAPLIYDGLPLTIDPTLEDLDEKPWGCSAEGE